MFRGGFIQYLLERDDVKPAWHDYTHHEFVERMGDGTLPREVFKNYMIQDYLYLVLRRSDRAINRHPLIQPDPLRTRKCPCGIQGQDTRRYRRGMHDQVDMGNR